MSETTQLQSEPAAVTERAKAATSSARRWASTAWSAVVLECSRLVQSWHIRRHSRDLHRAWLECGRFATVNRPECTNHSITAAVRRAAELVDRVRQAEEEARKLRRDVGTIDCKREPSGARALRNALRQLDRRCRGDRRAHARRLGSRAQPRHATRVQPGVGRTAT